MKWLGSFSLLVILAATSLAQEAAQEPNLPTPNPGSTEGVTPMVESSIAPAFPLVEPAAPPNGFLTGNHNFPNFIGFMSNPVSNIDPRAMTALWPIFMSTWADGPLLGDGNLQLYGAGLYVALSERLSVGLTQGGYADSHFRQNRDGWLNLGGYAQYTLAQNVENQFLLTAGLRWKAPSGEAEVFQGFGPAYLAPYITFGKGWGDFHVLGTFGYEFPAGDSPVTANIFYGSLHLDRRICGWLYPLVEFNWASADLNANLAPEVENQLAFFGFGNFPSSGTLVTVAVGANAVLIPEKLEFGAVFITPIHNDRNFDFNSLLLKMVYRY